MGVCVSVLVDVWSDLAMLRALAPVSWELAMLLPSSLMERQCFAIFMGVFFVASMINKYHLGVAFRKSG